MRGGIRIPVWRALLAALALYGLLLGPFVAAASPIPPVLGGVHCAPDGDTTPAKAPALHTHQCCTAAQLHDSALPATGGSAIVAWPPLRRATVAVFRREAERLATGPPIHAHAPRGPPSV